jgi:hypothetical protein
MKKLAALPFSEHAFQLTVCEFMARAVRPELDWRAIPNGGKRDLHTAVKLKAEGVKRGTPDIVILLPKGQVAWLELKAKGGSLSIEQQAFRNICNRLGHHWAVAKTLDEVISFLAKIEALK